MALVSFRVNIWYYIKFDWSILDDWLLAAASQWSRHRQVRSLTVHIRQRPAESIGGNRTSLQRAEFDRISSNAFFSIVRIFFWEHPSIYSSAIPVFYPVSTVGFASSWWTIGYLENIKGIRLQLSLHKLQRIKLLKNAQNLHNSTKCWNYH